MAASLASSSDLLVLVLFAFTSASAGAVTFSVTNRCKDTLWPAATPPGGGVQLEPGKTWTFELPAGTSVARVWARTGCSFDAGGRGSCVTGDCVGARSCAAAGTPRPPVTVAEYEAAFGNQDFIDISLVDGFNVPMSFRCGGKGPSCAADVNARCPAELRVPGGCASACAKLGGEENCCTGAFADRCPPTKYSKFFKGLCPDAHVYPRDEQTTTFTCPQGANYDIVLCP